VAGTSALSKPMRTGGPEFLAANRALLDNQAVK
jgi:hypothetical protein